jgi:hypothetical protein
MSPEFLEITFPPACHTRKTALKANGSCHQPFLFTLPGVSGTQSLRPLVQIPKLP